MSVQMELHKIVIADLHDLQTIVLKELEGERKLPIMIGSPEAAAIDRRLKGIPVPRPMTHDLLANVIESLGASLERIEITNLHAHTFHASLHLRSESGRLIVVDSRPSDAIALGIASNVPIFVAESVLEAIE
jgi:uncharacterized protein